MTVLPFACFKPFWGQYLNYVQEDGLQRILLHSEHSFLSEAIRQELIRNDKVNAVLGNFVLEKDHKVIRMILQAIFKNGESIDVAGKVIPRPQWSGSLEDQDRIKKAAETGIEFV